MINYIRMFLYADQSVAATKNVKEKFQMKKMFLAILLTFASLTSLFAAPWGANAKRFPAKLVNADGNMVDSAKVLKGKTVLVYFSASWCGPCRKFTPELVNFYKKNAKKNNIEIVLVSSDSTADNMMKYMKNYNMRWYAVPFGNAMAKSLKRELQVTFIPMLAVFDSNGKLITKNARGDIESHGSKAVDLWKKPAGNAKDDKNVKNSKNVKKSKKAKKSKKK